MIMKALAESGEHTDSYYASTLQNPPQYPSLQEKTDADVCVIGGGFSGVSTALNLAEKGYRVVLLEAARIGWGASGRNGGQVIGGFSMDAEALAGRVSADEIRQVQAMGEEAVDIIRDRVARHEIDCDLTWGYCDVALKPRHLQAFRYRYEKNQALDKPHAMRLLERDELQGLIRSPRYLGGLLDENYGHLNPLKLCIGEAQAAAAAGVRIFEQSRAESITYGQRPRVRTAAGEVQADFLVICGDAYLGDTVPELSSRNLPAASFVIATEPLGERAQTVMTRNLAVCDQRWALDYFRLSADGRLLFGGACNYTGLAPADITAAMQTAMLRVFPQLSDVNIDFTWGGQIGISMNRVPQVGRLDNNVYFAQGYSGHGVAPTHVMGKIIAEAIAGQAERLDIFAAISHRPFPGGKLLRQPIYALGMMYYRLLDAL
ncbi:MAG: FAD-binding oxidoreductase [Pseudomonadota bacterium]|nr:FAD-binding oxidoreductase [Pseudomonadota bacterium]